jgi:predicted helicase
MSRFTPSGKGAKKSAPTDVGGYGAQFFSLAAVQKMQGDAKPDHDPKASAKLLHAFAEVGRKLADLHVGYKSAKEYPLVRQENPEAKLDWRVEGHEAEQGQDLALLQRFPNPEQYPARGYDSRLGNRSALGWVIDQYRVTRDEQGNIANDPNGPDDEQYILRLIGQVITVSLETLKLVKMLPAVETGI